MKEKKLKPPKKINVYGNSTIHLLYPLIEVYKLPIALSPMPTTNEISIDLSISEFLNFRIMSNRTMKDNNNKAKKK